MLVWLQAAYSWRRAVAIDSMYHQAFIFACLTRTEMLRLTCLLLRIPPQAPALPEDHGRGAAGPALPVPDRLQVSEGLLSTGQGRSYNAATEAGGCCAVLLGGGDVQERNPGSSSRRRGHEPHTSERSCLPPEPTRRYTLCASGTGHSGMEMVRTAAGIGQAMV